MRVIGIDPGTATTGYGILENRNRRLELLEYGCILTQKNKPTALRLLEIYQDLTKLIKKYRPQIIAVESVFFYNNVKTAIAVAQARGVVLLCGEQQKLKLQEFTPLQIKNSLTGYGKAEKKQVQYMVMKLLGLKSVPKPDDAADALAVAICATNTRI